MAPAVTMRPSPEMTSVDGPMIMSMPSLMSGLPAWPIPTMRPSRMPMSARMMPHQSRMIAFVMTVSRAPSARVVVACAMDSRIDLPPPKTASSPPTVRSRSIWIHRSVSPRRTSSPTVGP